MSENVIELNGKRYDALTGKMLGVSHARVAEQLAPAVPMPAGKKVIDGFIRPMPTHPKPVKAEAKPEPKADVVVVKKVAPKPKPAAEPVAVKKAEPAKTVKVAHAAPNTAAAKHASKQVVAAKRTVTVPVKPEIITVASVKGKTHPDAQAAAAHHPEHAKTLMRHTVHKPVVTMKPKLKAQLPAEMAVKTPSAIARKRSASQVDPRRQELASAVAKHSAVQHFQSHSHHAAAEVPTHHLTQAVPVISVKAAPPVEHRTHNPHRDIFEEAMAHATSHKEPAHKHRSRHRRLINTMAGIGAFLVIGGFITWLNMPNIQLHVASIQAGFKAEMPSYRPTGYAMQGGVQRYGNTVSMNFRSGSSQFYLTQQPSDWNSQTLLENTLALNGAHKTLDVNGRTVYMYGDGNAAWVDGGVRYDLTGNASLNADDITQLVSSL